MGQAKLLAFVIKWLRSIKLFPILGGRSSLYMKREFAGESKQGDDSHGSGANKVGGGKQGDNRQGCDDFGVHFTKVG